MSKKEFTILTGARQTGKSTLLGQLESYCKKRHFPRTSINLERKNILQELNENPLNILRYLPETKKKKVVFIDEIQYLDNPSHFLKLLYDEQEDLFYWRTSDGNEVDFVHPGSPKSFAIEAKFDSALIKANKYKKFIKTYPDIKLRYSRLKPFDEDFLEG